jgi:hypothetical protein
MGSSGAALAAGADHAAFPVAAENFGPAGISWHPYGTYGRLLLTVSGPNDTYLRREFEAGVSPSIDLFGLPDGSYTYELVATPVVDAAVRATLAAARASGDDSPIEALRAAGVLPKEGLVQSGSFLISAGALIAPGAMEAAGASVENSGVTPRDQVIPDDLIVQGSACVGLDCVNNENFGFDTIRLKENNLRIKFDDTSTSAGFPANDWQLTANDSASGGASKFSIEDTTGSRVPFTIRAGAATNSIFVDSGGRVGFRTGTPVLDLHVATGNTPALRLEQNSSSGFTAQTWDIAGNEANFFVRDVTGGSRLPFRIRPGAPTSSIDINASGEVGIGTASPDQSLHVRRSDNTAQVLVEEAGAGPGEQTLLALRKVNANDRIRLDLQNQAAQWFISLEAGGSFVISKVGTGFAEATIDGGGNLTIHGMLTQNSDINTKENISAVDPQEILQRVAELPISTWQMKTDQQGSRHLGPMAQDFYTAFGLGPDDRHIAPVDTSGVALAAVQALYQQNLEKEARVKQLEARLAVLEAKLVAASVTEAKAAEAK